MPLKIDQENQTKLAVTGRGKDSKVQELRKIFEPLKEVQNGLVVTMKGIMQLAEEQKLLKIDLKKNRITITETETELAYNTAWWFVRKLLEEYGYRKDGVRWIKK